MKDSGKFQPAANPPPPGSIWERFEKIREQRKLSMRAFSKDVGLAPATYGNVANRNAWSTNSETQAAITAHLIKTGVDKEWLLLGERTGEQTPESILEARGYSPEDVRLALRAASGFKSTTRDQLIAMADALLQAARQPHDTTREVARGDGARHHADPIVFGEKRHHGTVRIREFIGGKRSASGVPPRSRKQTGKP